MGFILSYQWWGNWLCHSFTWKTFFFIEKFEGFTANAQKSSQEISLISVEQITSVLEIGFIFIVKVDVGVAIKCWYM
jgi:hypothetical protein